MDDTLLAVLQNAAAGPLSDDAARALLDEAETHSVQALVAKRLLPRVSDSYKKHLRSILEASALKGLLRHRDFATVVKALDGIPVIALKGIHLASLVYGDIAVRPMHDLDLLVPEERLSDAGAAVERLGYVPLRPYTASGGYTAHHLPPFEKDGATAVEIHGHLTREVAVDTAELWQRSLTARIAGSDVRVLAPEDLLLHLAIHATYGHLCEHSARAWCDIAETINRYAISWTDVVERAKRWRCVRGTYLALRASRDLVAAAVPGEALRALRPDDFDEDLLRLATVGKPSAESRLSKSWLQFRSEPTLLGKARTVLRRIFVSRAMIADLYAVPRSSPRVFALYAVRIRDMFRRRPTHVAAGGVAARMAMEAFLRDE